MLPVFGNETRRRINLGGQVSVHTHDSIVNQARARRGEREDRRKQHDSALRIQAWWRGSLEARAVRRQLFDVLQRDPLSISALRCLVLIGKKGQALELWSAAVVAVGEDSYIQNALGPDRSSWIVLIRQVALLLLQDIALQPQAERSVSHLKVLNALLSPSAAKRAFGLQGLEFTALMTGYLLQRNMYHFLALAIINSPLESKASATLPLLIPLITHPLHAYDQSQPEYSIAFLQLMQEVLPIPLLPNRIPLTSLTHLSSNLPLSTLSVLSDHVSTIASPLSIESRIHLISNLLAFAPPRYPKLTPQSLATIIRLFVALMNTLPARALDPPSHDRATGKPAKGDYSSDSDDDSPIVVTVVTSTPAPALPQLDPRTRKRLQTIAADSHVKALLSASQRYASVRPVFFEFVLSLCTIWPSRSDAILMMLMVSSAGTFRELYRGYVRSSPLAKDGLATLSDPANAQHWPPLLVLTDLYAQALLTMSDDEFFHNELSSKPDGLRNPLTLDEVVAFSRTLLKITFTLYWRDDQSSMLGTVPGTGLRWDSVREKMTKALLAIHARDSRRPFTPPDHWLVTANFDMNMFVEAAIMEDRRLTQPTGSRALTSRQVASLSPRLGVLNNIPFAIPFETRFKILRAFIERDRQEHFSSGREVPMGYSGFRNTQRATVRRGHIAEDGFDKLGEADLKEHVQITFVDQFGEVEQGIDGGGVFKEFLTEICKEVFDSDRGLWLENKKNEIYPNPHAYATESHSLAWYRFIGRILGKAIYEGILVNVVFAGFFLAKWLGKQSFLDDLASLDPELYHGLLFLERYPGNPEDLSLNFTIAVEEFGVAKTVDLIPNGSNIPVTRDNRLEYILRISHFRLTKQIKRQSEAFFEGLSYMIDPKWLRMFNQQELQVLLGGVDTPLDIDDLRAHTKYGGLFDASHPTIAAFWEVVRTMTDEQQRALLRFVTSVGRPPLLGFKELNPPFCIRDSGGDESRLPTASTCFNLLKMPLYSSEAALRQKLVQALFAGAGFDLS